MWWLRCGILLAFTGSTWSSAAHLGEVPSQDPTASAAAADERRGLRWHLPVKTGEWTAETGAASSVLRQLPISNFWELDDRPANAHAGAQEGARRRLRDAILKLQQPEDCASANLCTCDYFEAGLFSMVHGRTACLLMALHMNCTLVDVPNEKGNRYMSKGHQYVNQEQCNISTLNSPWECYFAPLSTCQPKNRTIADKHSTQLCKHFHKHAPTVMRQAGLKSPLLLTSELTSYIMRPAPRLSASVQKWASRMGLLAANSTGSNEAEVFSRCLAVHIRHSDKKAVPLSEKQHTAFIGAADDLRSVYGYDVINYMTDDPNVDTLFKVGYVCYFSHLGSCSAEVLLILVLF